MSQGRVMVMDGFVSERQFSMIVRAKALKYDLYRYKEPPNDVPQSLVVVPV